MSPARLFCSQFTKALRPGKLGCRHNFGFNGTAKTAANVVPGAKHRRRGQTRRDGMRRKKPSRGIFLLTIHVDWEFHPSLLTINRDRFDVGAFHLFHSYFLFSPIPKFPSFLPRYASQQRRAAVEQRTDINNPEFPTDVLIIRFQGPPILAGSRARKRIFLPSSPTVAPLPSPRRRSSTSSSPSHDPLLSRTVSFPSLSLSPSPVSSSISSARFLSRGTPSASKFASRSKQRGTLPPLEMRVAYLWPKTVVRAYKESGRGERRGGGETANGAREVW